MFRSLWMSATLAAGLMMDGGARGQSESSAPKQEVQAMAIILDCSGSMSELTRDFEPKMMAAKRVVSGLIDNLPDGLDVAFTVYGHDAKLGCEAVKTVRPLSPYDAKGREELKEFVQKLRPTGQTPIALALHTVGEELAKTKKRCQIILITDGMETCGGDPAAEAAELLKKHDLKSIDVVGLGVHANELAGVKTIAAAGKGEFFDARTAKDLGAAFKKVIPGVEKLAVANPTVTYKRTAVSAIAVKQISINGFPKFSKVTVYEVQKDGKIKDAINQDPDQSTTKFGEPMPLRAGTYRVFGHFPRENIPGGPFVYVPVPLRIGPDVEVGANQLVSVDPNGSAAGIVVKELGLPNIKIVGLVALVHGKNPNDVYDPYKRAQYAIRLGQVMLTPPDVDYDVYLRSETGKPVFLQTVRPKAGEIIVIGGETNAKPDDDK